MRIEGLDGVGLRSVLSHSCVEKPTHEWGTQGFQSDEEGSCGQWDLHSI